MTSLHHIQPHNLSNQNGISLRPNLSSLTLQIALYYNLLFSLLFAILLGNIGIEKVMVYDNKAHIVVLIAWFVFEPIRIYYGFSGNLKESVPHLSSFLLMTAFPQLPLVIYLGYLQILMFPMDPILCSLMFIFLVLEFFIGLFSIRRFIKSQTAQFMQLVHEE